MSHPMSQETIKLKIKRQDNPRSKPYWQEFEIPYQPLSNVISCLQDIQKSPSLANNQVVNPVVWDCSCLEEVCGSCTMIINGRVRQACTALVDQIENPIVLEPMSKFPVVRDLLVDRNRMFRALKKVKAWVDIDGSQDLGFTLILPGEIMSRIF